jgi:energy-coupling factor transport system substrate-specific component
MSLTERLQKDFTTITLALIPVAIVINIVIGQLIILLKLPVYLDSIGTVLVGVLAGPLAGGITGALTNVVWGIIFSNPQIIPFAVPAFVIGLLAGIFAQMGWFKKQLPLVQGILAVVIVGGVLTVLQVINSPEDLTALGVSARVIGGGLAALLTILMVILVALRLFPPLVAVGGVVTGIVAALVSAPIAAYVWGGVTGAGTDALVALFQSAGANIYQAALGQGLTSDPFDKFVSFVVVWLILRGMSKRLISQFPRGSNVIDETPPPEGK